jgi:flagellar hook-length control protein FliK
VPSVASEVSASLSLPPSPRLRPPPAGADAPSQPFSSVLDATTPAPEANTNLPSDSPDQAPQTETAPVASGARSENGSQKNAASGKATSGGADTVNAQETAPVGNKKDGKPAANTAANAPIHAPTHAPSPDAAALSTAKTDGGDKDGGDKDGGDKDGGDKDVAANVANQVQPQSAPQPVATAIVVASTGAAATGQVSAPEDSGAIDAGANAGKPVLLDPKAAPAADAKDTATADPGTAAADAKFAVPDGEAAASTAGGQPPPAAKANGADKSDSSAEKAPKAVRSDDAKGAAPADTDRSELRNAATEQGGVHSDTAGAAENQNQSSSAKSDTDALPNFGFTAPGTTAASSAGATAPTAGAVPIAGLAVEIAARAQAGTNRFEIRLDPPELGRIDVRLDVNRDGQVTSHVTVDRTDTLNLLQREQPQLERALEQAGLKTADNGLQFSLRDQSFAGQNPSQDGGGRSTQNSARIVIPDASLGTVEMTSMRYRSFGIGGGVDISV